MPNRSTMRTMGVAAAMAPMFPMRRITPFMVANWSLLNQSASTFTMGMNTTAAPNPMTNLPRTIREKLSTYAETALRTEPSAMSAMKTDAAFLGPKRSVIIPLGICIRVYA